MKTVHEARVGDTFCKTENLDTIEVFPGFAPPKQAVFAGLFPIEQKHYDKV